MKVWFLLFQCCPKNNWYRGIHCGYERTDNLPSRENNGICYFKRPYIQDSLRYIAKNRRGAQGLSDKENRLPVSCYRLKTVGFNCFGIRASTKAKFVQQQIYFDRNKMS